METEEEPKPGQPRMSAGRYVVIVVMFALVGAGIILCAEWALRIVGAGRSTAFFDTRKVDGREVWTVNRDFYQQFLSLPVESIMDIDDLGFSVTPEKSADTCRIVLLGSSAAHGCTPDHAYGIGRILEVMLQTRFPNIRIELLDASCPAINSHSVRLAAKACAAIHPDIYVVYTGNNEYSGPYGPAWTGEKSPNLNAVRVGQYLSGLRLAQVFSGAWQAKYLPRKETARNYFDILCRIPDTAPAKERMYAAYQQNLEDACKAGLSAGARVMLCSVVANLRDWAPFASVHDPKVSAEARDTCDTLLRTGMDEENKGNVEAAYDAFRKAVEADPLYAEAQYRLGLSLYKKNDFVGARDCLVKANQCDALQLRANGRINQCVRQVAAALESKGVQFVDIAGEFDRMAPNGIPDRTQFWDFVHFNFAGNYEVARMLFEQIVKAPPFAAGPPESLQPLPQPECEKLLCFTPSAHLRHARALMPAFTFWGVSRENIEWLEGRIKTLEAETASLKPEQVAEEYRKSLALNEGDYYLRARYIRLLLESGGVDEAVIMAEGLAKRHPWRSGSYRCLADALTASGDFKGAKRARTILENRFKERPVASK